MRALALGFLLAPLFSASEGGGHGDPSARVLLACAVILLVAKLAGHLARRLGQPAVLGELVAGVLAGNLQHLGVDVLVPMTTDPFLDMMARVGVVLLLFQVGLESTVEQMMRVGVPAMLVAITGVTVPFVLGAAGSHFMRPDDTVFVHVFVGATLTATSVGITARVFKDLNAMQMLEARIILGAAVIDDVLGLVILAVVTGFIGAAASGQELEVAGILLIILKAGGFLVVAVLLGRALANHVFTLASRLDAEGVLLAQGLGFCFVLSWAADKMGLAPIVGAFAAGLILEHVHWKTFTERGEHGLEELVQPIASFLVPIFFVLTGMKTDLRAFLEPGVATLALVLTASAVVGKLASGWAAPGKGLRRVVIGVGMMPRGEVGLIFANIGTGLVVAGEPVVSSAVFSALVVMIIVTTMATPPILAWVLRRGAPP